MTVRRVVVGAAVVAALIVLWILDPWGGPDSAKPTPRGAAHGAPHGSSLAVHSQIQGGAGSRRIAGIVLFDDGLAPPATVRLVSAISSAELASTRTDASGHFDFGLVLPVTYVVAAEAPGATGAAARVDLRNPIAEPEALRLRLHGCQASIFGVVADASGGTIANARVATAQGGLEAGPGVDSHADGSYELCVPVGDSAVIARADGYADTALAVSASGRVQRDIAMSPEAIVAGRVVRADDGQPVPNANLTLVLESFARGSAIPWYRGTSGSDGTFRLRGVAPGRYTLTATAEGLASEEPTQVVTEVEAPAADVVCEVQPALTLGGKVIDRQTKKPIAGATVTVSSTGRYDTVPRMERAFTQSDGTFVIDGLFPGDYTATVADHDMPAGPSKLKVPAAEPVTLEVDRLASIAGRVTRNGKPVDGARVMAQRAFTTSDADGQFVLRGLQPGDYHVYAECRCVGAFTKGPAVTVSDGEQKTGVEVVLDLAGSIAGTVVDQNGAPVSGVVVRFSLLHGTDFGDATTAADGTFTVTALSGGGDYIYAVYDAKGSSITYRPASGKRFPPVSVEDADTHRTGLRIQIRYDRLSISGRVLTSDGRPAPDVVVSATRGEYDWAAPRATTDMTGGFTIKDLPAGKYEINATSPHGGQSIPDVAAGTKNLELRFPSLGTIVGTLEGFTKSPRVTAFGGTSPAMYHAMVKGTSFTIADVPIGEYNVIANAKDGFDYATVLVTSGADASVVLKNDGVGVVEGHVIDASTRKPVSGLRCSSMGANASTRSDDAGAFRIEGAPAGTTHVYCGGPRASGQAEVVIAAGKTTQVEIVATEHDAFRRSYSGLKLGQQLDDIVVTAVAPGSPADRAGIQVDDFFRRIEDERMPNARQALLRLEYPPPGKRVEITIEHDDKERTVTLELAAPP